MAIVNEYDMISRADGPYLRSVVDLYRARNGLPPVSVTGDALNIASSDVAEKKAWPLPPPAYNLVGDIIVLRLRLMDIASSNNDDTFSQAETLSTPVVKAVEVTPEEFSKLLFCDIATHRRMAYLERMEMMSAQACGSSASLDSLVRQAAMGDDEKKFSLKF